MLYPHRGPHLATYNVRVITPPEDEPITVEEARAHLRITQTDEDDWIAAFLAVSREYVEFGTARALAPQTLELVLPSFPWAGMGYYGYYGSGFLYSQPNHCVRENGIVIPMAPIVSITSVVYRDEAGVDQTMDAADYYLDPGAEPAVLYPVLGGTWPSTAKIQGAVRIRYQAGYNPPGEAEPSLPFMLKAAILLMLGHFHENRENTSDVRLTEIPNGAASCMARHSLRVGFA